MFGRVIARITQSKFRVNAQNLSPIDLLEQTVSDNLESDPHFYDEKTEEERRQELEELNQKMIQLQKGTILDKVIPGYRASRIIDAAGLAFVKAIKASTLEPIKPADDPKTKGH